MKITLKHFTTLLNYIAVGLVVRGIWHGFFSNTPSIISGAVWFLLFFISHILEQKTNPSIDSEGNRIGINIPAAILISLLFLFGVSLVVSGFQYFLDNPYASLIMIPMWYILSLWLYPLKKKLHPVSRWKILPLWLIIWWLTYIALNGVIHTIPTNRYNVASTGSIVHQDYIVWENQTRQKWWRNLRWALDGNIELGFLSDLFKSKDNTPKIEDTRPTWMSGYTEQDIYTHCISMSDMEWCQEFLSTYTGEKINTPDITEPNAPMNHSTMINSELDFLALMIPHHQEAIDSSADLLKLPGLSNVVKTIAQNIVSWQNTEIRSMLSWLNNRYSGVNYTWAPYMPMMRDISSLPDTATKEKTYIQDMITHHLWAVQMAEKVLTFSNIHIETRRLANDIINTQTNEISLLESILNAWSTPSNTETLLPSNANQGVITPPDSIAIPAAPTTSIAIDRGE